MSAELRDLIGRLDAWLDETRPDEYVQQPLAWDWARVTKVAEETGEVVDAWNAVARANVRKGLDGDPEALRQHLFDELGDVALTALYAIQHFTKDADSTWALLLRRAGFHAERVGA